MLPYYLPNISIIFKVWENCPDFLGGNVLVCPGFKVKFSPDFLIFALKIYWQAWGDQFLTNGQIGEVGQNLLSKWHLNWVGGSTNSN